MTTVAQPLTTVNIVPASTVVQNETQKILFVGQEIGTANPGALIENVQEGTEDALFGARSMLAGMFRSAREINKVNRFDALVLDDAGTAATGAVVFTGTATEDGSITVSIGSSVNYSFDLAITTGDTATDVGDALVTALTNNTDVPVAGVNTTGSVALTASNQGTLGNAIGMSTSGTVAGVTVALTAMSGGATDPTFTGIFDVIGDNRYQAIVWPYFADTEEVRSLLDGRFNADNDVLDGIAFTSSVDTLANHISRLTPLNTQSLVDFTDKTTDDADFKGPAQLELPQIKATQFAAIRALRLTDGTSIARYVISSNGALDSFGGPALASKPYFNTPLPDLPITSTGRGWTKSEIEQLHDVGGSVLGTNSAGNAAISGEVVTTYKTDVAGNSDPSFKYLNYVDTMSQAREYFFSNLRSRFAQSRLTEGDLTPGRDSANAASIAAFCTGLYQDLSGEGFVLFESGEDALNFWKRNLIITIDKVQGRATIQSEAVIVTQLREIFQTLQLSFSGEG